jgi:hypothetical protein
MGVRPKHLSSKVIFAQRSLRQPLFVSVRFYLERICTPGASQPPWSKAKPRPKGLKQVYSPFTIHHSPFTIPHSPFTIHHSPFTIPHSLFPTHHSPLTIHHYSNAYSWKKSHINCVALISTLVFPVIQSGNGVPPGQVCPPSRDGVEDDIRILVTMPNTGSPSHCPVCIKVIGVGLTTILLGISSDKSWDIGQRYASAFIRSAFIGQQLDPL